MVSVEYPTLLNTKQAAAFLGLAPKTLHNWRNKKVKQGPPYIKYEQGVVRYRLEDLQDYQAESVVQPSPRVFK